jgi:hypothetical protein
LQSIAEKTPAQQREEAMRLATPEAMQARNSSLQFAASKN